jgi:prepilin-type N-terminal cleavage/methylation domain-containing protein
VTVENPKNSRGHASGFTLIEVLLAVAMVGIILTTVYGALSRTMFSKQIAEERAELYANGRDVVLRMAGEIETALTPPSGDRIYFRGSANGEVPSLEFIAMNRGGYGLNRVRPGRVLIAYTLDPLPNRRDVFALRREEHLFAALLAEADGITSEITDQEEEEENPAPKAIATYLLDCPEVSGEIDIPGACTPVAGLTFRYFDDFVGEWREDWDSTAEGMEQRLPAAVEISLFLLDERGAVRDFTTIVDLPLARGQPTPRPDGSVGDDEDELDDEDDLEDGGEDDDDPDDDDGSTGGGPLPRSGGRR